MLSGRQLQQFVAVAEELHFGRAASRLAMAQSPLSQAIRTLEDRVGVPLLERDRRSVALTGAGRVFLAEARALLLQEEQAVRRARWAHQGGSHRLSIGFVGSVGHMLLPRIVRQFHQVYPNVRLSMSEDTSVAQVEALRAGRLDFGIIRAAGAEAGDLSLLSVSRERMAIAMPRSHRLAGQPRVALADLAGDKFVLFSPSGPAPMHAMLVSACRQAGFEPSFDYEVRHLPNAIGVVASGAAIAMLPMDMSAVRHRDVVFKRIAGFGANLMFEALAAWLAASPNPSLALLLETLPRLQRSPSRVQGEAL
jgi:DNA-binding transcriptional LysR family regulator